MPSVTRTNRPHSAAHNRPNQNVRICQRKCDSSQVPLRVAALDVVHDDRDDRRPSDEKRTDDRRGPEDPDDQAERVQRVDDLRPVVERLGGLPSGELVIVASHYVLTTPLGTCPGAFSWSLDQPLGLGPAALGLFSSAEIVAQHDGFRNLLLRLPALPALALDGEVGLFLGHAEVALQDALRALDDLPRLEALGQLRVLDSRGGPSRSRRRRGTRSSR